MKKYVKAEIVAKNLPTGSYAAGCPAEKECYNAINCRECERVL